MTWHSLESIEQLDEATFTSDNEVVMLFKHSTTCSISQMAKMRLESNWDTDIQQLVKPYYLDLKAFRNVSAEIAERFQVHHESPQVLLIKNRDCFFDASHLDINVEELKEVVAFDGAK
jgi:bacillithiol system protein YtxJ